MTYFVLVEQLRVFVEGLKGKEAGASKVGAVSRYFCLFLAKFALHLPGGRLFAAILKTDPTHFLIERPLWFCLVQNFPQR